jgi:hypothetical protein
MVADRREVAQSAPRVTPWLASSALSICTCGPRWHTSGGWLACRRSVELSRGRECEMARTVAAVAANAGLIDPDEVAADPRPGSRGRLDGMRRRSASDRSLTRTGERRPP